MCEGCWRNEFNAAQIDTPAVRKAAELIAKVYEYSAVGGGLHSIVDDFNIEDENITQRYATDEDSAEQIAAENECLTALKVLTEAERASALALHDGYWKLPEGK